MDGPPLHQAVEAKKSVLVEHYRNGRLAPAITVAQEIVDLVRSAADERGAAYAEAVNDLGLLYWQTGRFREAHVLLEDATEVYRRCSGPEHADYATSVNNLGLLLADIGDVEQARARFLEALRIRRQVDARSADVAQTLNNLGELYRTTGRFTEAERLLQDALDLRRQIFGDRHPEFAASLNNLGELHRELAAPADAQAFYESAAAIYRAAYPDGHPDLSACLNNLAIVHQVQGDGTAAESLYREALTIDGRMSGTQSPAYAVDLNNLSRLHREHGRWDDALRLARDAAEIDRAALGDRHPGYGRDLNNLAELYRALGRLDEAEPLYRDALRIGLEHGDGTHPNVAKARLNLGELCITLGRHDEGLAELTEAERIRDDLLDQILSIGSQRRRLLAAQGLRDSLDLLLSAVVAYPGGPPPEVVAEAFLRVLRRKGLVADAVREHHDLVVRESDPAAGDLMQRLAMLRAQIADRTLAGGDGAEPLVEWTRRAERLESELVQRFATRRERSTHAITAGAVVDALPTGTALIEFLWIRPGGFRRSTVDAPPTDPPRYVAFVVRAGATPPVAMVDLGPAAPIDALVEELHRGIAERLDRMGSSYDPTADHAAQRLRRQIFDPFEPLLGGAEAVLLAPDGALCTVPFEVLPTESGSLLVDHLRFSYLSTARDLLRQAAPARPSSPAVVVAAPNFDLTADAPSGGAAPPAAAGSRSRLRHRIGVFTPLPGTAREGELVASTLGLSAPWTGNAALDPRVKGLRSTHVLHLATHGFFLDADPSDGIDNPMLRSGLALAGANAWLSGRPTPAEAEDGILTAEDVTGLDLLDTELVVLSACDTGRGDVRSGEGVFGLRRAVMLAGARTLVMSLWQVPDRSTRLLMTEFYRLLGAGIGRAESLRQAQLAVRARHPDPVHWGAFVCQGDSDPLTTPQASV